MIDSAVYMLKILTSCHIVAMSLSKSLMYFNNFCHSQTTVYFVYLCSHFNHENVLRVIGVCINNTPNFILLELMGAGNLLQFLRQAKRSEVSTRNQHCL